MANGRCFQSSQITGPCDVCKEPTVYMHLPAHPRGIYCDRHCPACSANVSKAVSPVVAARLKQPTFAYRPR